MTRILIMDDDGVIRGAIREILEAADYEVLEAADGAAGLELQRERGADLLVDLFMPKRDGVELIKALRQEASRAKVVAMSGGGRHGTVELLRAAAALGATRTLPKPFGSRELLTAIREALETRPPE